MWSSPAAADQKARIGQYVGMMPATYRIGVGRKNAAMGSRFRPLSAFFRRLPVSEGVMR